MSMKPRLPPNRFGCPGSGRRRPGPPFRVRHHGTDVQLDLVEQPAPTGGGETRLPDQRGVAPFKEVPDETFSAKVFLHLVGKFDVGLHHLHSPRGPMGWPVVSPIPWGFHGSGGRTEVPEPLRIHCGVVLHPASPPESHHSTQDRVTVSPRGASQFTEETFQRHHLRHGTPLSGRRENPFEGPPGEPLARMCKPSSESPEDVHLLDRRAIRWSQMEHGERAQCELHDNGPDVPVG